MYANNQLVDLIITKQFKTKLQGMHKYALVIDEDTELTESELADLLNCKRTICLDRINLKLRQMRGN
jgi:hypothetical protein